MSLLHYKNENRFLKLFRLWNIDQIIPFKYQQFLQFLEVTLIWQALCGLKMFFRTVSQNNYHTEFVLKIFKLCQTSFGDQKNWIDKKRITSSDQHLSTIARKCKFLLDIYHYSSNLRHPGKKVSLAYFFDSLIPTYQNIKNSDNLSSVVN